MVGSASTKHLSFITFVLLRVVVGAGAGWRCVKLSRTIGTTIPPHAHGPAATTAVAAAADQSAEEGQLLLQQVVLITLPVRLVVQLGAARHVQLGEEALVQFFFVEGAEPAAAAALRQLFVTLPRWRH